MLQVGDVIQCPWFAYGSRARAGEPVAVGGPPGARLCTRQIPEEERVAEAARTGVVPPKDITVDQAAHDETRGSARFVVEDVQITADRDWGTHIKLLARRLLPSGDYDPGGELIVVHGAEPDRMAPWEEIKTVGRMRRVFVW